MTLAKFLDTYEDKPRRKACMLALQSLSKFEIFKPELPTLFDTLLPVINNSKAEGILNLRELALNILSHLCKDQRENQKIFRRNKGIESLVECLQFKEIDQSGNTTTFLIAVLDCLANAVFGNKRSELHFLDIDGG